VTGGNVAVTPEMLTAQMVRDVALTARGQNDGFEVGNALIGHCAVWLRWDSSGRDHNEYNARRAARIICDAINARKGGG
jgi:hypothetical protein